MYRRRNPLLPRLLAGMALCSIPLGMSAQAAPKSPALPAGLSPLAAHQIAMLEADASARTPLDQKIDSQLLYAMRMNAGQMAAPDVPRLMTTVKPEADGLIEVDINATVTPELLSLIARAGGKVLSSYPQYHAIRAHVPLAQMERVAALPGVKFIKPAMHGILQEPVMPQGVATRAQSLSVLARYGLPGMRPGYAERAARVQALLPGLVARVGHYQTPALDGGVSPQTGSVDTEGDTTHRAITARQTYGANGTGIKVGVMSDSDDFLSESQSSGNLGTVTVLSGQSGKPGSGEGTAMMEIVHDIAPGAAIYFATGNASGGEAQMASNIIALHNAGCQVIVDDIGYGDESPFQDSPIAQAVYQVTNAGTYYFSSATNNGNLDSGQSGCYEGDFVNSGSTVTGNGGGEVHQFGTVNGSKVIEEVVGDGGGNGQSVTLFWSDKLGHSANDYNLFVTDTSGSVVAASTNTQNGTQDPFEGVGGIPNGYHVLIVLHSGSARYLHLDCATQRGTFAPIASSSRTRGHNCVDTAGAFGVAATPAAQGTGEQGSPNGPYPNPFNTSNVVETFSSDGPRHIFYNDDGTAITAGNFSSSGGKFLAKPDITAADGVTTSLTASVTGGESFAPFFGTSAAAPHAAAITALLLSYAPSLTQTQVHSLLETTATDIEASGYDRDSGYGILNALKLLQNAPVNASLKSVSLNPTSVTGGSTSTGTITLTAAAPSGGALVKLASSIGAATVPSSVTVAAGATTKTFTVSTTSVTATKTATITATYSGVSQTATLTITPATALAPTISSLSPSSKAAGSAAFTLTVNGAHFVSGAVVRFNGANLTTTFVSSSQLTAAVPASDVKTAGTYNIKVQNPDGQLSAAATFTVTSGGGSAVPTKQVFNPNPTHSSGTTVGTVTISKAAPTGGAGVVISQGGSTILTLTIAAGQTTGTYTLGVPTVTAATSFTIDATLNGTTVSTTLTVNPTSVKPTSLAFSPSTVASGSATTGTVKLTAAAPSGGALVTITQDNTELGTVLVAAGDTSVSFTYTPATVTATTTYTMGAAYNGKTVTTSLKVTP